MQLILKGLLGLTFIYYLLIASLILAYADIPDVSKWSCPNAIVRDFPNYGAVVTMCENDSMGSFYVKVSGELVYIHEHRTDANRTIFYNALKTVDWWVEIINKEDLIWDRRVAENNDFEMSISDDNGVVVAKRIIPSLKK